MVSSSWRAKKEESRIFFRHLKFDALGHVIDALHNRVVLEILIKLDTVLIEDKMVRLYHARFNERLAN